jgi:starch-binding outer membrane protein, SusD/RagB family
MRITYVALALGALVFGACNLPDEANLNNPSANDFSVITDLPHLQALITGVVRGDRVQNENEIIYGETMGRDGMRLTGSEPRFVTELLGPSSIDPSDFLGGALWPFATVRLANIGLHGINGAPAGLLNAQDKPATLGFVQTIKALIMLRVVETHDTTGAPIDVDIDPTGPLAALRCKNDVLAYVASLLDTAATNLAGGGGSFPFVVPPGFAGFDTPATFLKFNRGLAAKVNVYLAFRDYAPLGTVVGTIDAAYLNSAQTALTASFMTADATKLDIGPAHAYSSATGDAQSGLWDQGLAKTAFRANPRVVSEAAAGDTRIARKIDSTSYATIGVAGYSSKYVFKLYPDPTTLTPILTNKELLLLQAEVNWGNGAYATALAEANFIRTNDGGLPAATSVVPDSVLNTILYEKRYSLLWQSGSRWLDARMFGKLNASAPPAGVGVEQEPTPGQPYRNFPIPFNEAAARNNDLSKQACALP